MIHNFYLRRTNFLLFLAVCFVSLNIFAAMPARAGLLSVSPDKERRIGADAAKEIELQAPIVTGPVADWVESVGQRLAEKSDPEFQYSFRVIESPEINAFALPGGYIYVYTGLRKVAPSEDELAAVLAHEITHAEEHHFAEQYKKSSRRGLLLGLGSLVLGLPNLASQVLGIIDFSRTQKYSRAQETESDRLGMERMARAGYDPQGMVSLLDKLSKESERHGTLDSWFGSHPDGAKRVEAARAHLAQMKQAAPSNSAVPPASAPIAGEVRIPTAQKSLTAAW